MSEEEIKACFYKTDGLPVEIDVNVKVRGNIFIPKSELNAFRRKVYGYVCEQIRTGGRQPLTKEKLLYSQEIEHITAPRKGVNAKTAVIADDFAEVKTEIAIYKPQNYADGLPKNFTDGNFEKYIYYPAFATSMDLDCIAKWIKEYSVDGIYAENYSGILFARENNVKVFAGTGFNITNEYSLSVLLAEPSLSYFTISKELNEKEGACLRDERAFALSSGNIKIMDLCYCPFGKTCNRCDKKDSYLLTDENGRAFPVRRFLDSKGECKFEVFNCANLIGKGLSDAGQLIECTVQEHKQLAVQARKDESKQRSIYPSYTSGHSKNGVL